jgi:hypothetical protein
VVGPAPPLPRPLHPDRLLLDQPSRATRSRVRRVGITKEVRPGPRRVPGSSGLIM